MLQSFSSHHATQRHPAGSPDAGLWAEYRVSSFPALAGFLSLCLG